MRKRINALVRDKQIIVHHPFMLSKCVLYFSFEFSNCCECHILYLIICRRYKNNINISLMMLKLIKEFDLLSRHKQAISDYLITITLDIVRMFFL